MQTITSDDNQIMQFIKICSVFPVLTRIEKQNAMYNIIMTQGQQFYAEAFFNIQKSKNSVPQDNDEMAMHLEMLQQENEEQHCVREHVGEYLQVAMEIKKAMELARNEPNMGQMVTQYEQELSHVVHSALAVLFNAPPIPRSILLAKLQIAEQYLMPHSNQGYPLQALYEQLANDLNIHAKQMEQQAWEWCKSLPFMFLQSNSAFCQKLAFCDVLLVTK